MLTAWNTIGNGTRILLDRFHPISSAVPTGIEIDFPEDATGEHGFQNYGRYNGTPLDVMAYWLRH